MKQILSFNRLAIILSVLLLFSCGINSEKKGPASLPRSNPETEGVDSKGIIEFLNAAEKSKHELHSIIFLRHGKVIAEGWWSPYAPDLKHTLYSTSKSFTSTAVGLAVAEKRLKVTDKVISFFPESLPDTVTPFLADMEVRDLLSMSAGQDPDPTGIIPANDSNWVKAFLSRPVINDPGTKFLYNSMATYMLSAIVQKVTGEKVIDFLTPRLFKPLGIEGMDWETDPMGINTGGWGLRLKTEDMAKFGQLYLQKGKWNGEQILPESWVNEATTFKIDQFPGAPDSVRSKSDWVQGYCYQFWRCRNNAFRGDGAFGQYIIVMPDKDAVVAITSETSDMQGEIDLVWQYLLPSIGNGALPEDAASDTTLKQMLRSLRVRLPEKGIDSKLQSVVSGNKYQVDKNDSGLESLSFRFNGDSCFLTMNEMSGTFNFKFGKDSWIKGMTSRPGPNLLMRAKHHLAGIPPVQVEGIYRWKDENKLELTLRYIESPHTDTFTFAFAGDNIAVSRKISFLPEGAIPDMTGKKVK